MVTDDERRRMAERMRGGYDVVSDVHGRFWLNGTLFGMDITARSEEQIRDGLSRLADLIEPSESVKCVAEIKVDGEKLERFIRDAVAELAGVDRETLLDVLEEMDVTVRCAGPDVERGYVESWAERIREACGEVSS